MPTTEAHFRAACVPYMALLRADFPQLDTDDASAVFGNAGHESKGLTDDQEDRPTVKGSRGGLNWMQWTGPRRRAFEAYCLKHGYDANSDDAAYKWLFLELKTTEKHAIAALRAAVGLDAKVVAFEKAFLRAGIKHYPSRKQWAAIARDAYIAAGSPVGAAGKVAPVPKPPIARPGAAPGGAIAGGLALGAGLILGLPWWAWLLILAGAGGAGWLIWPRRHAIATHIRIAMGKL